VESEIDRLRKKVENFPSPSSYNRLAELLHLAKEDSEAEAVCRKCIKEFPRNAQAFVLLADIHLGAGRRPEATEHLRQALERDHRNYAAHRMLADLLAEGRDYQGAVAQLRQVLAFRPGDAAITFRIQELESQLKGVPMGAVPSKPPTGAIPRPAAQAASPAAPRPAAAPSGVRAATPVPAGGSGVRKSALDTLVGEAGVRGAVIVDAGGQVVVTRKLDGGADERLAAFAAAVTDAARALCTTAGQAMPASWVLSAEQGQILAFHRERSCSVVALADASVRPAMLELRARQALIDLGAP
jgi:predicted regulator of Ras-like GTPase activity (Roadblock/LC7/MglB family)